MNVSPDTIDASYGFCRQMSRRAGSSFPVAFLLLPREKRRAMEALYAFMRHTDDLADDPASNGPRCEALTAWRAALERVLGDGGRGTGGEGERNGEPEELQFPVSRILPALADTVKRFRIPREHLLAVIDGVEMDLDRRRYETFDELRQYCERVASAVGLACIHIWGFRGPEAFEPARQAGVALQLTNILRDLREDAEAGRVYLPQADLRDCDYSVDDLLAGVADERFHRLMAMEVVRAEQFYANSTELMDWLEPPGRRIFGLMTATYRRLLRKIARRPDDVLHRRVRLSSFEKTRLIARWSLLPPRKAGLR